jgi:hypothetical protein
MNCSKTINREYNARRELRTNCACVERSAPDAIIPIVYRARECIAANGSTGIGQRRNRVPDAKTRRALRTCRTVDLVTVC